METYANVSGQSGVIRYQIGDNFIIVEFVPNKYSNVTFYKYTYSSAGQSVIEHMKQLAGQGLGLHTYINTTDVKDHYESKSSSLSSL